MAFSPETYALLKGQGGGGSGGGGSCEVFPVNFTVEDGEVTEVDKTVSEIQEAVNGGKLIVGLCNGFIFYESSVDTTAGFYLYLDSVNYDVGFIDTKRIAYSSDEQAWFYSESEYEVGGKSPLFVGVTIDYETGTETLQKTWNEIKTACENGRVCYVYAEYGGEDASGISCDLINNIIYDQNLGYEVSTFNINYLTDSANGYPSFSDE